MEQLMVVSTDTLWSLDVEEVMGGDERCHNREPVGADPGLRARPVLVGFYPTKKGLWLSLRATPGACTPDEGTFERSSLAFA